MMERQQKWPEARPRWGTFSVRSHTELRQLIADVLMYDVVVFPCPENEEDFARWKTKGWDPGLLALRVTQLGDHAVTLPWAGNLREKWQLTYNDLPEAQKKDPAVAYILTQELLSDLSFVTLMGAEDDRFDEAALNPPEIHPAFAGQDGRNRVHGNDGLELVAAFPGHPAVFASGTPDHESSRLMAPRPYTPGLSIGLQLAVPQDADEKMFRRVIDLIENEKFRHARRRLWSWESELPENLDPDEVKRCLEALVADYNGAVEQQIRHTRMQTVVLFVPAVLGIAVDQLFGGGLLGSFVGAGAGVVVDKVKARFPMLNGDAIRASHHPGSAVEGILSVVAHG